MKRLLLLLACVMVMGLPTEAQPVGHASKGESVKSADGKVTLTCVDRRLGFGSGSLFDPDVQSPKSATFSADGKKLYVNSLEGCRTIVYDAATRRKLKTIKHEFTSGAGSLWAAPSGYYPFTHYKDGASRPFRGKPVEEALTPDGRYMFVPYYRRDFDLNAQDPSALAVIDTRTDEIVLMTETGPLPKMVRVSNDGRLLAITHWGDNTVGFLDISDPDPKKWRHLPPVTIGHKLNLNYSLTSAVNRDSGSGFLLRGTVFLPGDSLLLVSGMAGNVNVIDTRKMEWIGTFPQLAAVRHLTLRGGMLYLSRNSAGEVMTVPVAEVVRAIIEGRPGREFRVKDLRTCKVGGGARTLKVSPSGKYIFVACNTASALYVVETASMKVMAKITADSFPVGLDISPDGRMVVTTSQGRKGAGGGNAVDFFKIDYAEAEPVILPPPSQDTAATDSAATAASSSKPEASSPYGARTLLWFGLAAIVATIVVTVVIIRRRPRR